MSDVMKRLSILRGIHNGLATVHSEYTSGKSYFLSSMTNLRIQTAAALEIISDERHEIIKYYGGTDNFVCDFRDTHLNDYFSFMAILGLASHRHFKTGVFKMDKHAIREIIGTTLRPRAWEQYQADISGNLPNIQNTKPHHHYMEAVAFGMFDPHTAPKTKTYHDIYPEPVIVKHLDSLFQRGLIAKHQMEEQINVMHRTYAEAFGQIRIPDQERSSIKSRYCQCSNPTIEKRDLLITREAYNFCTACRKEFNRNKNAWIY